MAKFTQRDKKVMVFISEQPVGGSVMYFTWKMDGRNVCNFLRRDKNILEKMA